MKRTTNSFHHATSTASKQVYVLPGEPLAEWLGKVIVFINARSDDSNNRESAHARAQKRAGAKAVTSVEGGVAPVTRSATREPVIGPSVSPVIAWPVAANTLV